MILGNAVIGTMCELGFEPGCLVLSAVAILCSAIATHAKSVDVNDANVLEAARRAEGAHRLMKSLASASFPDDHPAIIRVVHVLKDLEMRARQWCESPKWSKRFGISRSGTSKACKYRACFQQLFALLDRSQQELMSVVQVDSYSNLKRLRSDFEQETVEMREEFSAVSTAAGEQPLSQAEVLEALGVQGASLDDLLTASRTHANALAKMDSHLDSSMESLKADLAAGTQAAQAATKAADVVAKIMQEHSSLGGRSSAADNTDEIVAALKTNILNCVVPELLDVLVREGKLTREAVNVAKEAVLGKVQGLEDTINGHHNAILERLEGLKRSSGDDMAKLYRYDPYNSGDGHSKAFLGRGAFGKVYRMVNANDMQRYALKLTNAEKSTRNVLKLQEEAQILAQLDHPNIVRYYGCFHYGKSNKYWALAMAYLSGGSLIDKMKSSPEPRRSLRWVLEIASALAYLHERHILHCDLKPENVLFTSASSEARAVVIDFGLASKKVVTSTAPLPVGAMLYRSPEKALGKRYGAPGDIWSLGLITAGLALEQPLEVWVEDKGSEGGHSALDCSRANEFIADAVKSCPSLGALAGAMLKEDPSSRPSAASVVESRGKAARLASACADVTMMAENSEEDDVDEANDCKLLGLETIARAVEAEARAMAPGPDVQQISEVRRSYFFAPLIF